jgi:hypothetical protein
MKFRLGLLLVVIGATALAVLASSQGAQIGPALGHQPQVFVVNADGSALRTLTPR